MSRDLQEPGATASIVPGAAPGLRTSSVGGVALTTKTFRASTPELNLSHSGSTLTSGGTSNVGVPTLTTPTLTPTTLRNIEQIFAESDPNEPPHHHQNAAGFVPPIVSPTSGSSFSPIGLNISEGEKEMTLGEPPPLLSPQALNQARVQQSLAKLTPHPQQMVVAFPGPDSLPSPRSQPVLPAAPFDHSTSSSSSSSALPRNRPRTLNLAGGLHNNITTGSGVPDKSSPSARLQLLNLSAATGAVPTVVGHDETDMPLPRAVRPKSLNLANCVDLPLSPPLSSTVNSRPKTLNLASVAGGNASLGRPKTLALSCDGASFSSGPSGSLDLSCPKVATTATPRVTRPLSLNIPSPKALLSGGRIAADPHLVQQQISSSVLSSGGRGVISPSSIGGGNGDDHPSTSAPPSFVEFFPHYHRSRTVTSLLSPRAHFLSPTLGGGLTSATATVGGEVGTVPKAEDLSTPTVDDISANQAEDLSISKAEDLSISRPNSLPIQRAADGGLPLKSIEFLEKFLKAAAASSPLLNTPTSAIILSPVKEVVGVSNNCAISPTNGLRERSPCHSPSLVSPLFIAHARPASPADGRSRSPSSSEEISSPSNSKQTGAKPDRKESFEEDDKKALRRERNKQAAARCRKRRLDLTVQLQDEVSHWEQKTRTLKEQLVELEAQKKRLESDLLRHSGPCKVKKKCKIENC